MIISECKIERRSWKCNKDLLEQKFYYSAWQFLKNFPLKKVVLKGLSQVFYKANVVAFKAEAE